MNRGEASSLQIGRAVAAAVLAALVMKMEPTMLEIEDVSRL